MDELFGTTTKWMDVQLQALLHQVPRPRLVRLGGSFAPRFIERSPQQAIVQKLAKIVSGLRAASHLLLAGFLQEQGALCRIIFELEDDVTFLALASRKSPHPPILERYLDAFFEEENAISDLRAGKRVKGRNLVSRKDIVNFIAANSPGITDTSSASNTSLALGHTFSGYIHGASVHIMEMYDATGHRFVTEPAPRHPLVEDHAHDIWNYYYRGILAFQLAAWAIGDENSMRMARDYQVDFERASGERKDF